MIDWNKEFDSILDSSLPSPDPFRPVSKEGIVLYGAGAMGKMAFDLLKREGIIPKYFVDKGATEDIDGIKIIKPEDIDQSDLLNLTFVICIASIPVSPIFDFLKSIGCKDVRHFYDYSEVCLKEIMTNGWSLFYPNKSQIDRIRNTLYDLEHDDYSTVHYLQFLWWRIRRKEVIYPNFPVLGKEKYFFAPSFPSAGKKEKFLDGGAHHGTTISLFYNYAHEEFGQILAFEPDHQNCNLLKKKLNPKILKKTKVFEIALSDHCGTSRFETGLDFASSTIDTGNDIVKTVTMDSLVDISPTIIKLHIEGDELKALNGAMKTIDKERPIVMTLADHNSDGLYKIPDFFRSRDSYKLYFYLHDYCGNSGVFYAYPLERLNRF